MSPSAYLVPGSSLAAGPLYEQAAMTRWLKTRLAQVAEGKRGLAHALALYDRLDATTRIKQRMAVVRETQLFDVREAPLDERMRVYSDVASRVADEAFPLSDPPPARLIQVTCTGYESPWALQTLAARRSWTDVPLLQLGHMGCYAAMPATRMATALARAEPSERPISLLFVELCTLHLDPGATAPDKIVIHHLFGDAAIRVDVANARPATRSLEWLDGFELLLPDAAQSMTWHLGPNGFAMHLARHVPDAVAAALPGAVGRFLMNHGLYRSDVKWWAVHPGGAKIVDGVAEKLELGEERVRHSQAVFAARGNVSSATVPHVWRAMLDDPAVKPGDLVVSLAFGPGLTLTGNLLRVEAPR